LLTDTGKLRIDTPRDRDGSFAPVLIPKHRAAFTGFDDKIIGALRARHDGARDPGISAGGV
jgi:putative transposase